jgi:predicted transcriptional regulator
LTIGFVRAKLATRFVRASPRMPPIPPVLGDLEISVLEDLWEEGASDAKAVHARIRLARSISLNTVQSTLERLHRKGLLDRHKVSHAFRYGAVVDRSALLGQLIEGAVSRVAGNAPEVLLAAFVDIAARAGEERLRHLEALVAAEREAGRKCAP